MPLDGSGAIVPFTKSGKEPKDVSSYQAGEYECVSLGIRSIDAYGKLEYGTGKFDGMAKSEAAALYNMIEKTTSFLERNPSSFLVIENEYGLMKSVVQEGKMTSVEYHNRALLQLSNAINDIGDQADPIDVIKFKEIVRDSFKCLNSSTTLKKRCELRQQRHPLSLCVVS